MVAISTIRSRPHAAYDLIVEGESYRAKLKPKVREDDPPPPPPANKKPLIGRRR